MTKGPTSSSTAGGISAIANIVVVLQENHTFDNYFGTYPAADGVAGKGYCLPDTQGSSHCVSPFHDTSLKPVDMSHNWKSAHADYDSGKMDGFVYSEGSMETMGYYERADLPRYWAAADSYVLCDRYFTSVMSESAPNHLFLVAGTAGGLTDDNVPKVLSFPPVFQQLDRLGKSWKVYSDTTSWFKNFAYVRGSSAAKGNFKSAADFLADAKAGALSDVSWVIGAPGGDEHPSANIQAGEGSVADDSEHRGEERPLVIGRNLRDLGRLWWVLRPRASSSGRHVRVRL